MALFRDLDAIIPRLRTCRNVQSRLSDTKFSSKAYGTRESKSTSMEGRVPFDVLQVRNHEFPLHPTPTLRPPKPCSSVPSPV
jgi:hypothetical protein